MNEVNETSPTSTASEAETLVMRKALDILSLPEMSFMADYDRQDALSSIVFIIDPNASASISKYMTICSKMFRERFPESRVKYKQFIDKAGNA